MDRLIIVSNRLPVGISFNDNEITVKPNIGGLATGLNSFYKKYESMWIGWSGYDKKNLKSAQVQQLEDVLQKEKCFPVYLSNEDIDNYYNGFSNETIWPLFHYFTEYTIYKEEQWEAYKKVNQQFAKVILKQIKPGDRIWIHDYHLLLLPKMIKDKFHDVSIGFFLHIPFPSYEVFRILPWREEILKGMLGADLVGFHTYDYERHFLSCVRRLLGSDTMMNQVKFEERIIKVDAFPMGIDYDKFYNSAIEKQKKSVKDYTKVQQEIHKYFLASPDRKLILSIDRLDYSKGLPNRLLAYEYFLDKYPQYREKVTLILLAVPTRENVEQYQVMKSEVDELVGHINGKYGIINWTPIWYFYRTMPFDDLIELYNSSEIALLTPIRDGMNLVAKEFVASKIDKKGVLILSEMAGASKEMGEAIIINPNNLSEIADALDMAIRMPEEEQKERNTLLQNRLKRYNVDKWATDFVNALDKVLDLQKSYLVKIVNSQIKQAFLNKFKKAKSRIIFLDYDGTLVDFKKDPMAAKPDKELYDLLANLISLKNTELVIISGRDKNTCNTWFGDMKNINIISEHGAWHKYRNAKWEIIESLNDEWKELIRPLIEFYVDRTPGTFIEEKNYSLVWHYRTTDPDLGIQRAMELKDELTSLVSNLSLEIMEGNKVIEIKNSGINKGRAALHKLGSKKYDFIMGIGDDWTDEYLFESLPDEAVTIKVGIKNTSAKYNVKENKEIRQLLSDLCKTI